MGGGAGEDMGGGEAGRGCEMRGDGGGAGMGRAGERGRAGLGGKQSASSQFLYSVLFLLLITALVQRYS